MDENKEQAQELSTSEEEEMMPVADEVDDDTEFEDIEDCWYPDLAQEAVEQGIVSGYKDGDKRFLKPKENLTREQGWLMLLRMKETERNRPNLNRLLKRVLYPGHVRIWAKGAKKGVGTGFFITHKPGPVIVTCYHVVEPDEDKILTVDTHFKKGLKAKLKDYDKELDLAVLEFDEDEFPDGIKSLEIKPSDEVRHAEYCVVFGHPGSEFESITDGIVANHNRGSFIETDARINPGNSGGIVVDKEGKLIGVPSHKVALEGFDNQNYCIKSSLVKEFLDKVYK